MKLSDSAVRTILQHRRWNPAKCRPLLAVALGLWAVVCVWMFILWTGR